eukprot:CAMPEP_0176235040 /NCGR_PEP_ID=MMETSP0121_2-20121125/26633_1 /TAXON_ID=160619 /ORGANISM="Kryptoperidinium foliaceum, Strain CCMP 1326" /LENGTH=258 /DNA_ID=CAMNT_0017574449 /DNA_START=59 /DNA_END=832 /DNA_ORIENTATION=-
MAGLAAHTASLLCALLAALLPPCVVGGRLHEAAEGIIASDGEQAFLEAFQENFESKWWVRANTDVFHGTAESISFYIRPLDARHVPEAAFLFFDTRWGPHARTYHAVTLQPESALDKSSGMRMCVRGSLQRSVHDAAMELIFCRREQERRIDVLVPEAWMAAEQLSRSVVGMGLADRRPVAGVTEDFAASFGRMAVDADRRHAAPPAAMAHVQDRRPALEHVAAARPPPSGACMKEIRCSLTPSKPLQDSYRGMCREG